MPTKPVTYADLAALLEGLGFFPKPFDARRTVYFERDGDAQFVLPSGPPKTPAGELDVRHVRLQLDMRGLMEAADFDAYFNSPRKPAKR